MNGVTGACPCGSGRAFADCCQVYHLGKVAESAEVLMRSRYSAFVVGNIDYIIATTLPAQAPLLDRNALQAWADEMTWADLTIKSHQSKIGRRHAQVHFIAKFIHDGQAGEHDELSAFVRVADDAGVARWYFLDPTVPCDLTNKQPCLCGSGEKFKACCGKFL